MGFDEATARAHGPVLRVDAASRQAYLVAGFALWPLAQQHQGFAETDPNSVIVPLMTLLTMLQGGHDFATANGAAGVAAAGYQCVVNHFDQTAAALSGILLQMTGPEGVLTRVLGRDVSPAAMGQMAAKTRTALLYALSAQAGFLPGELITDQDMPDPSYDAYLRLTATIPSSMLGKWILHGSNITVRRDGTATFKANVGPCTADLFGSDDSMCRVHTDFRGINVQGRTLTLKVAASRVETWDGIPPPSGHRDFTGETDPVGSTRSLTLSPDGRRLGGYCSFEAMDAATGPGDPCYL